MSSKTKTTATKEDAKSVLVPKLRFPAFRGAKGWVQETIGEICKSFSGGTPSTTQKDYYGGNIPFIRSAEIGRTETELFLTDVGLKNSAAKLVEKGDVLIALYGANSGDVALGKIDGAINQAILCLQSESSNAFIYQFLSHRQQWIISTYLQGGQGNLSGDIVKSISLGFPTRAEQQKIAECLSSVDEVIAAQARKLSALRTHKNGLMQQLFPREGETEPRLRFPEFRGKGEWEMATIGDIFETSAGGTPERSKMEYWNGSIPWVTTSLVDFNVISCAEEFITNEGLKNSSAKMFPKNTVLVALIGQGRTRGKAALLDFEASTNQNCAGILPTATVIPNFTFLNLCGRYEEMRALSNTAGQGSLSQGLIRTLPFCFPKDKTEQHRIADCLSTLDNLIAAESQKLENLKTHKRGLMQQLFPSPEEVEA